MSFKTHPDYTADTQANITAQVPDVEDGALAFATAEQTLWLLSKTSVLPLGPAVLATKSGVGRWLQVPTAASPVAPNYVEVDLDFGTGGVQETTVQETVVASWVTANMSFAYQIVDTPTKTSEEAAAEGFTPAIIGVTPGVGFVLLGVVQNGSNGTFRVRVTGVLRCL
jgi:hypothetical protein